MRTASVWPVRPEQTSSYVGCGVWPPAYPADVDQTPGQTTQHLVPVGAHRRQVAEVVEQGKGLHRLQPIGGAVQEQGAEGVRQVGLQFDGPRQVDQPLARPAQRIQRLAIAPL